MSTLSQFAGGEKYAVQFAEMDMQGTPPVTYSAARQYGFSNGAAISAAAGAWQTVLDVSGSAGILTAAVVSMLGSGAGQTVGLRITIDGVVYSRTSAGTTGATARVISLAGAISYDGSNFIIGPSPIGFKFDNSLKIEAVRSSTGTTAIYWTHALEQA